jgi:nicotinate-nucleotide adenylyltransferase
VHVQVRRRGIRTGEAVAGLRLGIFGGAFNPPHIGHLVCAQEAHLQLGLDAVVWVPMGEAPHREIEDDPGPEARLQMCEYAVAADERFGVSRIEVDRAGPSYTVDTLRELHARGSDDELFLILGGDQAAALASWHEPEQVLERATLVVFERVHWGRNAIGIKIGRLRGAERVRYLDMPLMQVSSSAIRRRVREGVPIRYLVPDKVAAYIDAHELYGAKQAVST